MSCIWQTHEYVRFVVPPMTYNPLHSWKSDTDLYGGIYRSPFSTVLVEILDLLLSYAFLGFQECFRVLCLWWIDPESWCHSLFCRDLIVHHSGLIHISFVFLDKWISTFSSWLIDYYICRHSFRRTARGNISIPQRLLIRTMWVLFHILSVFPGSTLCAVSWQWYDSIFFDTLNKSNGRS